jgi:hypothetical protein
LHSSNTGGKWEYSKTVYQLFVDFKKAYDSVRREVLYNNLIEFGVPMKLVRLIKMCLYETYSKNQVGLKLNAPHQLLVFADDVIISPLHGSTAL